MTTRPIFAFLLSLTLAACAGTPVVQWQHGNIVGRALICVPEGKPPFPAVVHNHGIIVDMRGYNGAVKRGIDMPGICQAFAKEGFLAFLPIRGSGLAHGMLDHFAEVRAAFDAVRARPDVDRNRVSFMGMSRGGLLTLMAAVRGVPAQSFVMFAPAPGKGTFQKHLQFVHRINAPVLAMVEDSDDTFIKDDVDQLERALRAAGRKHKIIRYDRGGGHRLFATVDYYWDDLMRFLRDPSGI